MKEKIIGEYDGLIVRSLAGPLLIVCEHKCFLLKPPKTAFRRLRQFPLNLRKSCNSRTRGVWSFSWVQSCRSRHRSSERERRAAQRVAEAQDATRGEPRPSGRAPVGYYWDPRPGEPTGTWRNLLTNEAMDLGAAKRDTKYAAELLGLRLDVPWSVWHGYEAGGREPGILWRYDAEGAYLHASKTSSTSTISRTCRGRRCSALCPWRRAPASPRFCIGWTSCRSCAPHAALNRKMACGACAAVFG